MKMSQLNPCAVCSGPLLPMWHVIRMSMAMLNAQAANQVIGLTRVFGGSIAMAEAMAPDSRAVTVAMDKSPELMQEFHICNQCYMERTVNLAMIAEAANEQAKRLEKLEQ